MCTRLFSTLVCLAVIFQTSCTRDPKEYPEDLQHVLLPAFSCTQDSIFQTRAYFSFQVQQTGTVNVHNYGVVWDTFPEPRIAYARKSELGPWSGAPFSVALDSLIPDKEYYLRAFIQTAIDTVYFEQKTFRTKPVWQFLAPFPGGPASGVGLFRIGDTAFVAAGYPNLTGFHAFIPADNLWKNRGLYPGAGKNAVAAFSIGDTGYVGTGTNFSIQPVKSFVAFDTEKQVFTPITPFGGAAREGAIAFTLGGYGYVGAGNDIVAGGSYLFDFWRFDPVANYWEKVQYNILSNPNMAFVIGNKAYLGYGLTNGVPNRDFWEFDPSKTYPWRKLRADPPPRSAAFGFSIGSKGYLTGGGNDIWEFDPYGAADGLGAWRRLDHDMPLSLSFSQAVGFDNFAIIIGGRDGAFGLSDVVLRFNPE
ncbi:MAG: hypothetical protein JNK89_02785 [Saprospiraceae bacterium]|nr:hypothetical protein [Saprospiraceae bacterium]